MTPNPSLSPPAMPAPQDITSRHNPRLLALRKIARDSAGYRDCSQAWLAGEHLLHALAARGGAALEVVIAASAWADPALRALCQLAPRCLRVDDSVFAAIGDQASAVRIAGVVAVPPVCGIDPRAPTVVLDRVQDPGNVGSILRSAAAFGFTQVVALTGSAALWSPRVLRAAMGAHFGLRLVEQVEPAALRGLQVPRLATGSHEAQALHRAELPWPCAWLFGNEGQGVAPELMAAAAHRLRIVQPGGEESLNVAAAAAICLHESARRRPSPGGHWRPEPNGSDQ